MEDEDYPETAVQIALYKETLMDKKYTEVPVDGDIVDYNYSRYLYIGDHNYSRYLYSRLQLF